MNRYQEYFYISFQFPMDICEFPCFTLGRSRYIHESEILFGLADIINIYNNYSGDIHIMKIWLVKLDSDTISEISYYTPSAIKMIAEEWVNVSLSPRQFSWAINLIKLV